VSVGAQSPSPLVENVPQGIVSRFRLQQAVCGGVHSLLLAGELDLASAPDLVKTAAHIPMDASAALVLNLRKVTFIDCAGIRAILAVQEICAQQGCGFSLVPGRAHVQRLFELCKLDHLPFQSDCRSDLSGGDSDGGAVPDRLAGRLPPISASRGG
jgi:anti-anti-sigma factor